MYYNHNIKKKGISDNYLPNYHTRHYRVFIGKIGDTEIDFLAEKPNEKIYIQVTESLASPKTRERELRPLLSINDNYEKIILTFDRDFIISENGIKIINVIDWLIEDI